MGAMHDKTIPTKFHFGNALLELDHLIPRGDEADFAPFEASVSENETELRLHQLSMQIEELSALQSKLSFALRDIKRSTKR